MSQYLVLLFTGEFDALDEGLQKHAYLDFYNTAYPVVYVILKDHGATEDMIQESFIRAIDKSRQLQDLFKMESWVRALARNVTLNYLRKFNRNREELEKDARLAAVQVSFAGITAPVHQEVEVRFMKEAIASYLSELKPEYRRIIEMRWMLDLSYKEMAVLLNVSEGTVRQKLFRARETMKQRFRQEWGTP